MKCGELIVDLNKLNQRQLIAMINMNQTIISEVPIGFCITDENGIFEEVNSHYCKIYGYRKEELLGNHFSIVATADNREELTKLHDKFIKEGYEISGEWKVKRKNGEKIFINVTAARVKGIDGACKKVTYIIDITEKKKHEKKLEYLSFYDQMTGIYNRRYFENELKRLESSRKYPITIVIGDLDGLKFINDNYGHQKGDEYIINEAYILKSTARAEDIVARIGGDEFAIVLPTTTQKEAKSFCQRIQKNIKKFNEDKDLVKPLSISLGFEVMEDSSQSLNKVFNKADQKMYINKGRK